MKQELLFLNQWRSPLLLPSRRSFSLLKTHYSSTFEISSINSVSSGELTAKEKRQLRKEKRESKAGESNWRDEVEERLMVKPKKEYRSWTEKLNLDNLAINGRQWWVVRVRRINGDETSQAIARALVRNYPDFQFKVYYPAVREQRKLKNGSFSVKLKPLFPGCVFLNCVLNKEIHDFIRECDGVGGFIGSTVGNTKRQINRPKPVPEEDMEAIFQQAKEEQEKADQEFIEEQLKSSDPVLDATVCNKVSKTVSKPKRKTKKALESAKDSSNFLERYKHLTLGASVRVLSGPFTEFTGRIKGLNQKNGTASVGFTLFGKESVVEMEVDNIVAETT